MDDTQTQSKKVFTIHCIIGKYEVEGTITCFPAPPPGFPPEIVQHMIDAQVEDMVKDRMIDDLFSAQ